MSKPDLSVGKSVCLVVVAVVYFISFASISAAENQIHSTKPTWDPPKAVDPNTVLLMESDRLPKDLPDKPEPGDKSYGWYHLDKGNNYLLMGDKEKAAAFFREAYMTPGPTRALGGFKLVDTLDQLGRVDEALDVLGQMQKKFLISTREFGEAKRIQMQLEDKKRLSGQKDNEPARMLGKDWLYQLSAVRTRYVLDAMDTLRAAGIPLLYPAHHYVFLMDEYFLKDPGAPADHGPEILANIIYEEDPKARLLIDLWRQDPAALPFHKDRLLWSQRTDKITGADWITMVHNLKHKYILEAMEVLRKQHVPMEKTSYAYEYLVDELFTRKPELPAHDSVVALATILYETEPKARNVLEALRLES